MSQLLKTVDFATAKFKMNKAFGYFPYFQFILRSRINKKKAVNVVVTGEAGEGKSYMALTLCRLLDRKLNMNQIVFTFSEYMKVLRKLSRGRPIMFDEPSYAMGKREWYKQVNQVLVKTIESQRFMVHPLFIPIINKALLDKTIRDHLIQFQVVMKDRGKADVYRLEASQFIEKTYHRYVCSLRYPMLSAYCKRDSCLGCRKLKQDCPELRAHYERKKLTIQMQRYEQAEQEAKLIETKDMTDQQLAHLIYTKRGKIINDRGKVSAKLIRIVFIHDFKMKIGHNRCYTISGLLKLMHPSEFE